MIDTAAMAGWHGDRDCGDEAGEHGAARRAGSRQAQRHRRRARSDAREQEAAARGDEHRPARATPATRLGLLPAAATGASPSVGRRTSAAAKLGASGRVTAMTKPPWNRGSPSRRNTSLALGRWRRSRLPGPGAFGMRPAEAASRHGGSGVRRAGRREGSAGVVGARRSLGRRRSLPAADVGDDAESWSLPERAAPVRAGTVTGCEGADGAGGCRERVAARRPLEPG